MNIVAGYSLVQQLYVSDRTVVYRGTRESDQYPVIIKLMRESYPSFSELVQFRNAYSIAKSFDEVGIVKAIALENVDQRLALVMEDFGGIALNEEMKKWGNRDMGSTPERITQFLHIALQLAEIFEKLYQNGVIHKDVKPHNIIINPQTQQIQLIDFSSASLLSKETPELRNPNVIEGTLAYMSPEQTGRMNRGIDYRSDFYSLGVTFYELLTGQLPFISDDPIELIHCHIARQPIDAIALNPTIPEVLNQVVLKLMAKAPEDRYQSASGLRDDLDCCQHQWQEMGEIALFELGQTDRSDRFTIPDKLYGRETEVETLLNAFGRVSAGRPEIMLVAGLSGIGKSALVNQIHRPIVHKRGYFISGKFDQLQRDIPLSAFVHALRDLMRQILSESKERVKALAAKLQRALGSEGQVLIEVIPEVELLIGKQPPVTELSPSASQNRFNLLFQRFIKIFAKAEHPLVIFLDDLQWADLVSLQLLQRAIAEAEISHLLLMGAYRDNEVSASHPLILTLEQIRQSGTIVNEIVLSALSEEALNSLISDTLSCAPERSLPLTRLIAQKTQGNPFFSAQFLKTLHEEGLIVYDRSHNQWQYDLDKIEVLATSGDIVEFIAERLRKLPQNTQEVLQLAACIGNQFDLATLSVIGVQSLTETANALWSALQEGAIVPDNEIYKFYLGDRDEVEDFDAQDLESSEIPLYHFLHDRVQQAAYSLIPEERKRETHLQIGQLLLQNQSAELVDEKIFEIVNQLNYGLELIYQLDERDRLAQLNLQAGRKAKASTAYEVAIGYFHTGLKLLPQNSWQMQYELTLALHEEAAEVAYLTGDFDRMEQLANTVLQKADTLLETVKVCEIRIQAYIALSQLQEALEIAVSVLGTLGIQLPENPTQSEIDTYLQSTRSMVSQIEISKLSDLPSLEDPKKLAAIRILSTIFSIVFVAKPNLLTFVICEPIRLAIEAGLSPLSGFSFANYGLLLCSLTPDISTGYKFGRLACELLERFNSKEIKTKVFNVVYCTIEHWENHIEETLNPFLEGYQNGLETGDLEYGTYCLLHYSKYSYFAGNNLSNLEKDVAKYSHSIKQLKQQNNYYYIAIVHQSILNLLGNSENVELLSGSAYDENQLLPFYQKIGDRYALFHNYFHKLILCYLFEKFQQARHYAELAEDYINGVSGMFYIPMFYFYSSLAQLAALEIEDVNRDSILLKVSNNQEKMQHWAHHAPMNHSHKYYLVEAERHRVLGQKLEAIEAYDRAIALARKNEYIQEEALANELCARFYLDWGKIKVAQTYSIDAYYGYVHWGAQAKVDQLEQRYQDLLTPILSRETSHFNPLSRTTTRSLTRSTASSTETSNLLDLTTVIKASQALSSEIQLDNLLATLMRLVLENAGAQKCALILPKGEQLILEAIARIPEVNPNTTHPRDRFERPLIPVENSLDIPQALINYVWRTHESLVFDDATTQTTWAADSYLKQQQPKSILCAPIAKQGQLIGIIYLENNLTRAAFTPERLELLELITTQAAISLENALLYNNLNLAKEQLEAINQTLEQKVRDRTQELNENNMRLAQTLDELRRTQTQLIQTEKMSSLGQLVGGVAHEINNPVNFIYGNLVHAQEYTQDLLDVIETYQKHYPDPVAEVQNIIESAELEFIVEDLPKLLTSMQIGAKRIRSIVESLRNFSRLDEAEVKDVDIHEGIENTVMILQTRLQPKPDEPGIDIVKNYGSLPKVECYVGQLNQVFINIINNAIDALQENSTGSTRNQLEKKSLKSQKLSSIPQSDRPTIGIQTELVKENTVVIRIADNGKGMSEEIRDRIFDPFFTTKPIGKGTGLGLAISYQIVVERHGGQLNCTSAPGQGTEFTIEIPLRQFTS